MSDDLIKFLRTSTSSAYNKTAADRIEELNERLTAATNDAKEAEAYAEELEARNKELTLQLLATSGQAADALDKLTKAVEALREIAVADFLDVSFAQSRSAIPIARAVLAELEVEPLSAKFEAVWDANKDKLYEE